jgi:hypothetical protein
MESYAVPSVEMPIVRLDRFIIPRNAYVEFLGRLKDIHALLHVQPGLKHDILFERPVTADSVHLISMVEWENQAASDAATTVVEDYCIANNFNRDETFDRLKIIADIGIYSVS